MTAIRSPHDPGATLKRVNAVLALYFVPDEDFETKAGVREEFVRALSSYPNWAIQQAFDAWARSRTRRPSPGDIVNEVALAMRPITDEIARRRNDAERIAQAEADEKFARCDPAVAKEVIASFLNPRRIAAMQRHPMATSFAEAEAIADAPPTPHWSETAPPDDPRWDQLRASRAANALVRASRERQEGAA